jgi:hypothetical protein
MANEHGLRGFKRFTRFKGFLVRWRRVEGQVELHQRVIRSYTVPGTGIALPLTMLRWRRAPPSVFLEFRTMDDVVIVRHLENFDRRLANVEQILPTLATREDLREAVAPLATKEDVRAVEDRLRRHLDVVGEGLRSDIQLLAEHLASVMPKGTS